MVTIQRRVMLLPDHKVDKLTDINEINLIISRKKGIRGKVLHTAKNATPPRPDHDRRGRRADRNPGRAGAGLGVAWLRSLGFAACLVGCCAFAIRSAP